jgi:hypothetical protein
MKKIYLLICSLCIVLPAMAQPMSRLIGVGQYDYNDTVFIRQDSFTYNYSSGRGSNMKTGVYKYDTSVQTIAGQPLERNIQTFYYPGHALQTKTTQHFVANQWENYEQFIYRYTGTGMYDTVFRENWNPFNKIWQKASRSVYSYNGNNILLFAEDTWDNLTAYAPYRRIQYSYIGTALVNKTEEFWNATNSTWVGSTQHVYQNDGNSRVIMDSLLVWDNTNMLYKHEFKTLYTYNTGGNIATMTELDWDPIGMANVSDYRHIYQYNTQNQLTNDTLFVWNSSNTTYDKSRLYLNTYDANGNLLKNEEQYIQDDTFRNYRRKLWNYNTFDQPTLYAAYEWDAANTAWKYLLGTDVLIHYTYQPYDPTSITTTTTATNSIKLYPNPTSDMLHIAFEAGTAGPLTITIFDVRGVPVKQWHIQADVQYNTSLPVRDLPAGHYMVNLQGVYKQMTQHIMIAR